MFLVRILPQINEAFMLASAGCVALGWRAIRTRRIHRHRRLMLTGSVLGALFFVSYVVKTLLVGDTEYGGPVGLKLPYMAFLQVHVTLATVAAVLGVLTLRWALRRRFNRHRRVAPWTAVLWFVAAGSGLVVYLLLYVVFPPGPTTNVLKAVVGH